MEVLLRCFHCACFSWKFYVCLCKVSGYIKDFQVFVGLGPGEGGWSGLGVEVSFFV